MAKKKIDGVVEAIRVSPDGLLSEARVFERFGPIFTDRILLNRDTLVARIKGGKRFYVGQRVELMGGTFEVTGEPLRVKSVNGREIIVSGKNDQAGQDHLDGAPLF